MCKVSYMYDLISKIYSASNTFYYSHFTNYKMELQQV